MTRNLPILLAVLATTTLLLSCEKKEAAPTPTNTIHTADSIAGVRIFTGTTVVTSLDSPGKIEYYNHTDTMTIEKRVGLTVLVLNTAASAGKTLTKTSKTFQYRDEKTQPIYWHYYESTVGSYSERHGLHYDSTTNKCIYYFFQHVTPPNKKGYTVQIIRHQN